MAVFRVERNRGYTVMSNHHLRNKELSLKAKGLLSQMLSLPEDWDYTLAGLSLINREKIDAILDADMRNTCNSFLCYEKPPQRRAHQSAPARSGTSGSLRKQNIRRKQRSVLVPSPRLGVVSNMPGSYARGGSRRNSRPPGRGMGRCV